MSKPKVHFRSSDGSWFRIMEWYEGSIPASMVGMPLEAFGYVRRIMVGPYASMTEAAPGAEQRAH